MKYLSRAIAMSAFLILASCGGDEEPVSLENQADATAAALENRANMIEQQAGNAVGAAEDTLENQAAALDQAETASEEGGNQAGAAEEAN